MFLFVFQIAAMVLYPALIQPIFNKLTPLQDGEFKDRVYALAKQLNFPLKNIYVIDGSKRSAHSNAVSDSESRQNNDAMADTVCIFHSTSTVSFPTPSISAFTIHFWKSQLLMKLKLSWHTNWVTGLTLIPQSYSS